MIRKRMILFTIFIGSLSLWGCSNNLSNNFPNDSSSENSNITVSEEPVASTSGEIGSRDNTSFCLVPSADSIDVFQNSDAIIDISNTSEGYIMASYIGNSKKVKLQITGSDNITYTYNLHGGGYEVFPLSSESGNYTIAIFENVIDNQYSTCLSEVVPISISNEFGPYLYPNQYVTFNSQSDVVEKAEELALSANSDLNVITNIYNYIIKNISYDYDKAENVQSGYTPDVDEILSSKTGICLDYAAVMTSMLRSQQIPTRLEVGYAGESYHAWISTYISDVGWVNGIIEFNGTKWELMDPTFAANSSEKKLKSFIGDGSNYTTKYIY
ncbi:MAG TPA: transglutaminase-like domain-containing protein [Lachnospiraceae bacterium]|nr:transglutaminase-like domain-containing protein [Lachnospiraceae bacterium]